MRSKELKGGDKMDTALRSGVTYEDYYRLDDDRRYEVIGGELFLVPSPNVFHQQISIRLSTLLYNYVFENNLGLLLEAPMDVCFTSEDIVQPDIIFISRERQDIVSEANIQGAPDLIIEILSSTTARRDRTKKKDLYARHGVKELWIIHPVTQTIEVFTLEGESYKEPIFYTRRNDKVFSLVLPELKIKPSDIF